MYSEKYIRYNSSNIAAYGHQYDSPFIPPVHAPDDQALMAEYLSHYFLRHHSYDAFADFLKEDYLHLLFARTMIMARVGDVADWQSLLGRKPASIIHALSTETELSFAPQSSRTTLRFAPGDPVRLTLRLKNVSVLTVREFQVDKQAYYRHAQKAFDVQIDLDGLTPMRERVVEYRNHPAVERHEEVFDFGQVVEEEPDMSVRINADDYQGLMGRGMWIIDFVGGRHSCRAVICKVGLSPLLQLLHKKKYGICCMRGWTCRQ